MHGTSYYALMFQVYRHNQMSMVPVEFHRDLARAQTVETRPFSPRRLGPGNKASMCGMCA